MGGRFLMVSVVVVAVSMLLALRWSVALWILVVIVPLLLVGLYDMFQTRHTIQRNFPLFGRGRWLMERLRPFVRQYFIESDTDGVPINRMFRSIVYQRAKGELDTVAYGSKVDHYRVGYEWIGHSLNAIDSREVNRDQRVVVGGPDCRHPYSASIFNISAMSYGALSRNAVLALNSGAARGNFFQNSGEGGLSDHHLVHGGDLVWQIGTGYFGCRDERGLFSEGQFAEKALLPSVKMIEIKLSQGAKPGHGGILPADKNSPEIAAIRGVEPYTRVDSPPTHSAFKTPSEMMAFIARLRELSEGKPIGIKLAIGRRSEFVAICKAMVTTGIRPDFITVDGGEGGTGAAPLEYANSVGMPLREALAFVADTLTGFNLKRDIRIIAAGKVLTGFHLVKNIALGADICNSGRGMMLALGCVHSLICNTNHCPTGVATQDPRLVRGLVVTDKAERVARYHESTLRATAEIIASAGLTRTTQLNRTQIFRRIDQSTIARYDEIFPYIGEGELLGSEIPAPFRLDMAEATADSFAPASCLTCGEHGVTRLIEG